MEGSLALVYGSEKSLAQQFQGGVVGKLNVVRTSHDGYQEIIRCVWWLAWFAHHREHGIEALEA